MGFVGIILFCVIARRGLRCGAFVAVLFEVEFGFDNMKNIVILISGGGSNMRALVNHVAEQRYAERGLAKVVAVISNSTDSAGLVFAAGQGIPTRVLNHREFASRAEFDAQLQVVIDEFAPDVVFLAGFMRILTPEFTRHYDKRMFNIHPSILPNFKGLHTHDAAIEAGVKVHGATVHGVTAELDHGPIVLQSAVPVVADDTADSLAARVLATEHVIYPQVLDWLVHDQLEWTDNCIVVKGVASQVLMRPEV